MNYLEHAYALTRKEWMESLEKIGLDTDPNALNDLLLSIQKDHDAFHHILRQRELFDQIENAPVAEVIPEPITEPEPIVLTPTYRIERLFKGANAYPIANDDVDYIFLNEAICLEHQLQTGSIVKGSRYHNYLKVDEVITHGNPNDNRQFHIYERCVVMIDKGDTVYINRYEDKKFIKDNNDELVRHNVTHKEVLHFKINEGDVVNVTEDRVTKHRMVTFKHEPNRPLPLQEKKNKKEKIKQNPPLTPEERREKLFKGLPATPETVLQRKVAILAPASIHQRLTDDFELLLGMRLTLLDNDSRDSQIETAFHENEFVLVSSIETTGALYKKMLQWSKDYDTCFRPVEHGGVSAMLRAIVEGIFEKEYSNAF